MRLFGILFLLLLAAPAQAADATQATVYAPANITNLMRAMLRSSALDPTDPLVRDDYLLVHECDLYRANYADEFKMKRLQEAAGKSIEQNRAGWPNAFTFDAPLQLDHYDFKAEQYLFDKESKLLNVNSFAVLRSEMAICLPGKALQRFPAAVSVRIDQPVSVPGIPIAPKEAEALLSRLTVGGLQKHKQVFARFSIIASFMPPVDAMLKSGEIKLNRYTFDGRLMQIEFFEDAGHTRPIWTLTR